MDEQHFIRLGLYRLRHPLPPVKLKVIHSLAEALQSDKGELVWKEYLAHLSSLSLESEAAEALMVAFLARKSPLVSTAALRQALTAPSPISDYILMEMSGQPPLINLWSKAHSGEVPKFYAIAEEATAITHPRIVPPIVKTRLTGLEEMSGYPFVRQWEYEVERLIARFGQPATGSFEYWTEGSGSVTQVIPRPCHYARSAYLRTLSLAFDKWGMPEDEVYQEAAYVIPGSLIYTQMPPGERPSWAGRLASTQVTEETDCSTLVRALIKECADAGDTLLHLNSPLQRSEVFCADLRIAACYTEGPSANPKMAMRMHDYFLNKYITFAQEDADEMQIPSIAIQPMQFNNGARALPAIAPAPMHNIGYLTTDLIPRFPHLPVPYSEDTVINAVPAAGGLTLKMGDEAIGYLNYWNQQWKASHPRDASTPCGVSLVMKKEPLENIAPGHGYRLQHFWELTILEREESYSDWNWRILHGSIE
ncbi:hypothetical protein J8I26_06550 [Herbaspirillum sp. LeCh32-8]|uniref:hypothetical protein n=1 Tax=Herbaspirillum sp. LeCh32-8 TaxID=2821356 RepID=UPI001AE56991|nr:hypothetical protein [Herbaspirillum sp. LeCh32-8]MBP0597753.1 hypothetical protein [Herbaspirillum sp. LeCh32-8]